MAVGQDVVKHYTRINTRTRTSYTCKITIIFMYYDSPCHFIDTHTHRAQTPHTNTHSKSIWKVHENKIKNGTRRPTNRKLRLTKNQKRLPEQLNSIQLLFCEWETDTENQIEQNKEKRNNISVLKLLLFKFFFFIFYGFLALIYRFYFFLGFHHTWVMILILWSFTTISTFKQNTHKSFPLSNQQLYLVKLEN